VHGLRYALDPSRRADAGHGYLTAAPPLLAALLALGVAQLLLGAFGRSRSDGPRHASWQVRWAVCSLALVALYALQENVESLSSYGQIAGPLALLAHGGWTVLPLAAAAGGVVAAALRGTDAVLASLRGAALVTRAALVARRPSLAPSAVLLWPGAPELARHLAGRAPPLRS
jgi:hypothetical protein